MVSKKRGGFLKQHGMLILILILLIGGFLRIYSLGFPTLSVDEAETVLLSENILKEGVPRGFYRVQFYENAFMVESESHIYEYKPTNYLHTDYVTVKGWLTYYFLAPFIDISNSEFILRLPFALLGIASLLFFFLFIKRILNEGTALLSTFFLAINEVMLFYHRQIRYYSLVFFFLAAGSYFFICAVREKKFHQYLLSAVMILGLFYTNILVCFTFCLTLLLYMLFCEKDNIKFFTRKSFLISLIFLIIGCLPWILYTRFFQLMPFQPTIRHFWHVMNKSDIFFYPFTGINNQGWLFFIMLLGIVLLILAATLKNLKLPKPVQKLFDFKTKGGYLLLIWMLCFMIVPTLLVPFTSFNEKLYLSLLIPTITFAAFFVYRMLIIGNKAVIAMLLLCTAVILIIPNPIIQTRPAHDLFLVGDIVGARTTFGSEGILDVIGFLQTKNISSDTFILTTSNAFPIMFYSDYAAQNIWPVRKSFIDSYEDNMIIVVDTNNDGGCRLFNMYLNEKNCGNQRNFLEKIAECEHISLNEDLSVFLCLSDQPSIRPSAKPDKSLFKPEDITQSPVFSLPGLFLNDFSKDAPPDFIWSDEFFPVKVPVKNMGDHLVVSGSVKAVLMGDLASDDFISNKHILTIPHEFFPVSITDGVPEFDNYVLSFGDAKIKKIETKEQVLTSKVRLCYPYQTCADATICESQGYLYICNFSLSGAPVRFQINQVSGGNTSLTVQLESWIISEGVIHPTENCNEDSDSLPIEMSLNDNKCKTNECSSQLCAFICKLDKPKKGMPIEFKLDYEFMQDFSKKVLIKNRALYKNNE